MSQPFSSTDEPWSRLPGFMREGVEVHVQTFAGHDHSAATTVFTSQNNSEVFHADKCCHRLHRSEPSEYDGEKFRYVHAWPLEVVMTEWGDPVRPCDYCTQDIHTTAEIAMEYDNVPESCLKFFEPGDKRVTTTVSRNDDGTVTVTESSTEVY